MERESSDTSLESFPEVDFVKNLINRELPALNDMSHPSDFKMKELNGELLPEPLLLEDKSRFVLFPIKQPDVSLCPTDFHLPLLIQI